MLEIVPDTNIWRGLSHKDTLLFEEFLRNTPAVCLLSSPARIEIVSHLGDNTSADFGHCKAAIRKIVRLCSRNQILVPEVEFLKNIGFSHYISPPDTFQRSKLKYRKQQESRHLRSTSSPAIVAQAGRD